MKSIVLNSDSFFNKWILKIIEDQYQVDPGGISICSFLKMLLISLSITIIRTGFIVMGTIVYSWMLLWLIPEHIVGFKVMSDEFFNSPKLMFLGSLMGLGLIVVIMILATGLMMFSDRLRKKFRQRSFSKSKRDPNVLSLMWGSLKDKICVKIKFTPGGKDNQ